MSYINLTTRTVSALVAVALPALTASAGVASLTPVADGYHSESSGINSSGVFLNMQYYPSLSLARQTALIEFDLSGVAASDVDSAMLTLIENGGGSNGIELIGYTGTADGALGVDDLSGGMTITTFDPIGGTPGVPAQFDVTNFVRDAAGGMVGFRFYATGDTTQFQYRGTNYGDGSSSPLLNIVPGPGSALVMGVAGVIAAGRRRR
ncbi:MAG: hypothetical protein RIB58_04335 [Phycisphaerales bacterium]